MRFAGLAVLLACGLAHADAQLASDAAPVQLATGGTCTKLTHLIGEEPGLVERAMKQHQLTPITLEATSFSPRSRTRASTSATSASS